MAVKRRVIWLTDADWSAIGELASAEGLTVSALIRDRLGQHATELERAVVADKPWERTVVYDERRVTTDAQLREVAGFNTRPFTPVPKTRK